ncbi:3-hydroxybutyryl-CoA dehydrogenase [bacterium BMS3Bbin02]|nr:3-hydroxybutyryl-CoA dehydrogenase [bacterium BMS3Bbin02]
MTIERVGIIGGGQMGGGIAEVCIKAGITTKVFDIDDDAIALSQTRITKSLSKAVERGKLDPADADAAIDRLSFVTVLDELADSDLVIEAVVENEDLKKDIFTKLDSIVGDGAILASNTSSIPLTRIGSVTNRPERVVGMHFFNPAPIMPLVEIISTVVSDQAVVDEVATFASETLGKTVVRASDRAGFIVNMLLVPYAVDAMRMYESGFASKEDIDAGMVNGAGYPMGPLALSDLIGLDTMLFVAESLFEEFREPRYAPPPLLRRMVEAGLLGRKSGRGFYDYT